MTQIILENRLTREGALLEFPGHLGFSELLQQIKSHPEYSAWQYIESRCI